MKKESKLKRWLIELLLIVVGSFIIAFAYHSFILPNNIVGGGASGVATLLSAAFGFNPAYTIYAINLPLLVLCYVVLGADVFRKTVIGSFVYPLMVDLTAGCSVLTENLLLACIFGGFLTGLGLAMIYRVDASTGGVSILVQILKEKAGMSLGASTMLVDGTIVLSSLFVFDVEAIFYAILLVVMISQTIDNLTVGKANDLNIFVISKQNQAIVDQVRDRLVRTVTLLKGQGGYSKEEQDVLFFVIDHSQYQEFLTIVESIDPTAFIVVNNAKEVKGRGFSLDRNFMENINRM